MIDLIYDYAKLYYECGDYSTASQYLNFHNELVPTTDKVWCIFKLVTEALNISSLRNYYCFQNYLSGLWGKLACNILLHQWDYGVEDFEKLKNFIDEESFRNSLQVLGILTFLVAKVRCHSFQINFVYFS